MIPGVPGVGAFGGAQPPESGRALARAAHEFEAYLVQLLLQEMRETIPGGGMGGEGLGGGVFQSLTDQALADAVAKAGGIGLTQALLDRGTGENGP
ncbi:MAG: rod-binding protein [Nitrospirota bacterium]